MPGTGAFGWLYPGQDDAEEVGHARSGLASSEFVTSGEDAATFEKSGVVKSDFVASGEKLLGTSYKSGIVPVAFVASGIREATWERTGEAVSEFVGAGDAVDAFTKTGAGIAEAIVTADDKFTYVERGTGSSRRTSAGSVEKSAVSRYGTAKSSFIAKGRRDNNMKNVAISARVASGGKEGTFNRTGTGITEHHEYQYPFWYVSRSDGLWLVNRSGAAVSPRAGSGKDATTFARSGTAAADFTTVGWPFSRGAVVTSFTGMGDASWTVHKSGTAALDAIAQGRVWPVGTAVAIFTGGGGLRRLYANDNFVNREIIDPPTGNTELDSGPRWYGLAGATASATNETGERNTPSMISRTLWWEYTVPYRCIVALYATAVSATNLPPAYAAYYTLPIPTYWAQGFANRGSAVNALSPYGDPRHHYGQDEGRGLEAQQTNSAYWGQFPSIYGTFAPIYVQVDPRTPLELNVGKFVSYAPDPINIAYTWTLERLQAPDNDDLQSAEWLTDPSGAAVFDMHGATGDPRWNWSQLDSIMYSPTSAKMSGDIFYRFQSEDAKWCRLRLNQLPGDLSRNLSTLQFFVFHGSDPGTWVPLPVGITSRDYYPYATQGPWSGNDTGYVEFYMEPNESYIVAVILTRNVSFYTSGGTTYFLSTGMTDRAVTGQLEWEIFPAGLLANDDFDHRINLGTASTASTAIADTRGSTFEIGEPSTLVWGSGSTTKTIWYQYTPPTSGWYSSTSYGYYTYFWIFRGSVLEQLDLVEWQQSGYLLWMRGGETYAVRLSSQEGYTADYGGFDLALEQAVVESNDDFADRIGINTASGVVTFNPDGATTEADEPEQYYWNSFPIPSLWWGFTAPATGSYLLRLPEWDGQDIDLAVYSGDTLATLVPLSKWGGNEIGFDAEAGTEYKITVGVYAYSGVYGESYRLEWEPFTRNTNSTFATAHDISEETLPLVWNNLGMPADFEVGAPDINDVLDSWDQGMFGRPVWFKFVPSSTAFYNFYVNANSWDGIVVLYKGETLGSLTPVLYNGDFVYSEIGYGLSEFSAPLLADETYYFLVAGSVFNINVAAGDDLRYDSTQSPQGRFDLAWTTIVPNDYYDVDQKYPVPDRAYTGALDLKTKLIPTDDGSPWYVDTAYGVVANAVKGTTQGATGGELGSTFGTGSWASEPSILGWPSTHTVWYTFRPYLDGNYEFWLEPVGSNPVQDPLIAVYIAAYTYWPNVLYYFSNFQLVAASDSVGDPSQHMTVSLGSWNTYAIQIDSRDEGNFELKFQHIPVEAPPPNDEFADAIEIVPSTPLDGTTVGARSDPHELPPYWGDRMGGSVWYKYTATETTGGMLQYTTETVYGDTITIYAGTTFADLVPVTEYTYADKYYTNTLFWSVQSGQTYYVRVMAIGDENLTYQSAHTLNLLEQSLIPPGNDDIGNATDGSPGTNPGSTDGSGLQPGEPDPNGGLLADNRNGPGGTTWHKYVAPAPGFIAAWVTRDQPVDQWYRIGVWMGPDQTMSALTLVTCQDDSITPSDPPLFSYYEVRQGETYWIQVIRGAWQTWGDYTLHIDEYLETKTWNFDTDGFDSTTGSPSITGGVMTCTGNQAISDVLDVMPQYGTVDLGADVDKWGREFRLHFEVRVVGGQCLYREMWYGGDDWSNDPWTVSASDDHVNWTTCRLGLFRVRDKDGAQIAMGSLAPGRDGQNVLDIDGTQIPVSLGTGGAQHDSGWVSIEIAIFYSQQQRYDGTQGPYDPTLYDQYMGMQVHVDGKPYPGLQAGLGSRGKCARYIDIGMYRHPSMVYANDQRYAENNETWTLQFRRMRATNIVPSDAYDLTFAGDAGVFEFDGFTSAIPWDTRWNGGDFPHQYSVNPGIYPYAASGVKPVLDTFEGYTVVHSAKPGTSAQIRYGGQASSRRWYGLRFGYHTPPPVNSYIAVAQYEGTYTLGRLQLHSDGGLWITPYGSKEFCVAKLAPDRLYWIEVHVDAEVMWDVRCTVYIEGESFGTFSNRSTGKDVSSPQWQGTTHVVPAAHQANSVLVFGPSGQFYYGAANHDVYFTHLVSGRGDPADSVGPLETETVNAIEGTATHHLPDEPDDYINLDDTAGVPQVKVYNWMYEDSDPAPITYTDTLGTGIEAPLGVVGPRFWEPYFRLKETTPLLVSGSGPYNYTMLGQSVPVDAVVTGISMHAPAGTARLLKNGSPVGDSVVSGDGYYGDPEEMWGATWTPQEVNDLQFGVQLSVGAALTDVRVEVWFADEGGPGGIDRGSILVPAGLYNVYGDWLVVEMNVTGTGGDAGFSWPTGGWEPGGWGGGPAGPLSGSPLHRWGALRPLWLWQARGDKVPYIGFNGGGEGATVTASDTRIVRNPLAYPRYAWSDDNGVTWTWMLPGETTSATHIGTDVGVSSGGKAIFLDNAGTLDVHMHQGGGWSSGLNEDRPSSSPAYRYAYWYTAYTGGATSATEIMAANLWARWRPYSNAPTATDGSQSGFQMTIADDAGGVRRVARFSATAGDWYSDKDRGTSANPHVQRSTRPRSASGDAWTPEKFNALTLRTGMYKETTGGMGFFTNYAGRGAALYAATWELLVPGPAGIPPPPCGSPTYTTTLKRKT